MKTQLFKTLNLKVLGGIVGTLFVAAAIAHHVQTSQLSSNGSSYATNVSQTPGMTSGAWDIGNVALTIAHHLTGSQLDNFDAVAQVALGIVPASQGGAASMNTVNTNTTNMNMSAVNTNGNTTSTNTNSASNAMDQQVLKNAKAYWQQQCHGVCPIPFQCAMFVETVYGAAGHPLPQTYNAVDYWKGYQNRADWKEIPVGTKPPAVGDMVVWDGGLVEDGYTNGIGHIAIVVAVQLPTATQNGSVTVAQSNSLTTDVGNFTTPSSLVSAITTPGIRLYQMPIMPDYSVKTWGPLSGELPYHVLGYIRNTTLQKPAQFANALTGVGYSVVGAPTITADHINRILAAAKSPAVGQGQALYDGGVKYGIDPIYALAFFKQESSFGIKGEASTTLSLGNLRCISDRPCVDQARGGYAQMQSWGDGFDHWYALIAGDKYVKNGLITVDQIIPVYAPPADNNNDTAYINAVKQNVDQWRSEK